MRLFFCCESAGTSSLSLSLASRFTPAAMLVLLAGVSGGVVIGTPVTLAELVAAIPGTLPPIKGGLLITGACVGCVAIDEVELDLVGDEGRALTKDAVGGGEGAVNELAELRC